MSNETVVGALQIAFALPAAKNSDKFETAADDRHKKTDLVEHPKVNDQVGLLVNEPSGRAGLLFI